MNVTTGTHLGPYELLELAGSGGMGNVYRALDPRLGRDVAVKVLPSAVATEPERLRRFALEARAVAALNHPNILTIHDVGSDNDIPYVVTELLQGETWRDLLARRNPTARQVLSMALQAAQGLAAAHAKGLVHRDLKPENLFLTTDGRVKILDFGLAKQVVDDPQQLAATVSSPTAPDTIVGTLAYMAPEQIQAQAVDARADVFAFGIVLSEMLGGRHPFRRDTVPATVAAILRDDPFPLPAVEGPVSAADAIVRRCLAKRREDRFADGSALVNALGDLLQAPSASTSLHAVEEHSPFPGLRSFTERDADVFFGREEEVSALWSRIRTRTLLGVIGPSGAGKTSFLRAGVVTARPPGWAALVCTPGTAPLRALGQALAPELATDPDALRQLLSFDDPAVALSLLRRWRHSHDAALLVIDQFEELFTLNPPDVRDGFARLLGRLTTEADIHVVLSLRDDFLMRCHAHTSLAPVFSELTPLGPLSVDALRHALVEPAAKRGYRFEDPSLVDEMVDCVWNARAALPLLAFAVGRLWEDRDREKKLLTRAAYERAGGVAGALAQHAESTLDRIGSMQQDLVRELFRRLVTGHGTRAVIDRDELLSALPDRDACERVLEQLIAARLLTCYDIDGMPGQPARHVVEIAHESLLQAWPRLVRWQTQDEDGAQLRDQLKLAAHLWADKGRSTDLLWTGAAFDEFVPWRQRYRGTLTELEEDFASAMALRVQRQRLVRRATVAAAFVLLAAVAIAVGISRQQAVASARRAEGSRLLALAELRLGEDPTEALALVTASLEQADTADARTFALKALWEAPPAFELTTGPWAMVPAFSPDGRWLAISGLSPEVRVLPDSGGQALVLDGHEVRATGPNVAKWASNELLVTGLPGRFGTRAQVWSIPQGKKVRSIEWHQTGWEAGSGTLIAETGLPTDDRSVLRAWRLPLDGPIDMGVVEWSALGATQSLLAPDLSHWVYLKDGTLYARPLPFGSGVDRPLTTGGKWLLPSPGGLVTGDVSGEVRAVTFRGADTPTVRTIHRPAGSGPVSADRSGRWLYGVDRSLRLSAADAWPEARPLQLRRSGSRYLSTAAVHPAGDWIVASTSSTNRMSFWPLKRPLPIVVDGYSALHRFVAFSPDGKWLATGWNDGRLRLWPMPGANDTEVRSIATPPGVWFPLEFDATGRCLLAGHVRGALALVAMDGSPPKVLSRSSTDAFMAAIAPSGRRVAIAFTFGQGKRVLTIWDVETGATREWPLPTSSANPGAPASGLEGGVLALAFADDATLLTAGDGGLRRWNIETGTSQLIAPAAPGHALFGWFSRAAHVALTAQMSLAASEKSCSDPRLHQSAAAPAPVRAFSECYAAGAIDPSGSILALASRNGTVQVANASGGSAHLLVGHRGAIDSVAISPDRRWVATSGEDDTLRLWPLPDLSRPSLHTLPLRDVLATLRSLTNVRAVRDQSIPLGWRLETGAFPGWKEVPLW